jgi:hypothetical protein
VIEKYGLFKHVSIDTTLSGLFPEARLVPADQCAEWSATAAISATAPRRALANH